ncbi:MAG: hypothetical protein Q8O67_17060 [Deltaproteobacteria bacterium]|nr:hypothetical protein [Deltaproteobacteria bacterium]
MSAHRWQEDWPLFVLGVLAVAAAGAGVLVRRRRPAALRAHLSAMGLSYIATLTAFYVDNGPQLPLWNQLPPIAFWFLPSVVGLPIVIWALVRRTTNARPRAAT